MRNRKAIIVLTFLLLSNICVTMILGIAVYKLAREQDTEANTNKYVMYIGLNDKDSYEQIISKEDAEEIIDNICLKYVDGYTIQEATGSWVDEKENVTCEETIVCYFNDADEGTVYKIADEVIEKLNQNTVLIEKCKIETDFYGGDK